MSVSARDSTFDVQICAFIFLVSDLVIINNKGEIGASLRDLFGVCIYALKELNKGKPKKEKSRVMFSIRDQTDGGTTKQKQMLSNMIEALE